MSAEKTELARAGTMQVTAKEGRALVGDKLGDTRGETKNKAKKGKVGRSSTMSQVAEEAKLLYGDMPATEGRSLRKRAAPPPAKAPLKKKGTMQRTAKEGKEYLKRGRPKKNAEKKEEKEEENNKNSEEEEKGDDN